MVPVSKCLIDTNILLRLTRWNDPQHNLAQAALDELNRQGSPLYFAMQNIAEFWNVCTRPVERNGFGLSTDEANRSVKATEQTMTLLPDNRQVYAAWREIVLIHEVRGVQVHDARLAAITQTHGVPHILTLNGADFRRYSHLQVLHPSDLQPQRS